MYKYYHAMYNMYNIIFDHDYTEFASASILIYFL